MSAHVSPGAQNGNAAESNHDLHVRIEKTVEVTSSYRYCWYPIAQRFPTGEIMVTMRMHPDERHPEGAMAANCISRDNGATWSPRYTIGGVASPDAVATQDPLDSGAMLQLWLRLVPDPPDQSRQFRTTLTEYTRAGLEVHQIRDTLVRFAEPVRMTETLMSGHGNIQDASALAQVPEVALFGTIIPALNGDLLATVCCRFERDDQYYRSLLLRSKDAGRTWVQWSTVASVEPGQEPWEGMGELGPGETSIVRLADDRLYAIFRTESGGHFGQAWSSDDGRTWTPPESMAFRGVAPRLRRLSNGVLACSYGRPGPVTIMFDPTGTGAHWAHVTPVFEKMSTRYTDIVELEPGRVLLVYDSVPRGWEPIPYGPHFKDHASWDGKSKNTIYATFVRVERETAE